MSHPDVNERIANILGHHAAEVRRRFAEVRERMDTADRDYSRVYRALGLDDATGRDLDERHLEARFVYNHAGVMIEKVAIECVMSRHAARKKVLVDNVASARPIKFEIDVVVERDGIEIKWKDATTDGDHVTKEKHRVASIKEAGYRPIRLMFFEPSAPQSKKIQDRLSEEYAKIGGEFHRGLAAFDFIRRYTGVDMLSFFP